MRAFVFSIPLLLAFRPSLWPSLPHRHASSCRRCPLRAARGRPSPQRRCGRPRALWPRAASRRLRRLGDGADANPGPIRAARTNE